MRIDRLRLPNFRNLKNFEIDFDESVATTVIMGRNGSGKSNLIEALVEIFRDLVEGRASTFSYQILYRCHGHAVQILNDTGDRRRQYFGVDGVWMTRKDFEAQREQVLPQHIFAYYSGWNRRLESGFDEPTRELYKEWLNNEDRRIPLRRLFYCRKEYSQLVLLAFFLIGGEAINRILKEYLQIDSFESALFTLKTPWWRVTGKPSSVQLADGDPRFWYARGAFKHFLDDLWKRGLAPIRNEESVERDIRGRKESTERLYLFIKDLDSLKSLGGENDPKTFFGLLESLFLCDLIDDVQVSVRHLTAGRISFAQLSEGEQQLLTVLGLMIFTRQDESLFLLDEPDTHLNPSWVYEYYSLLEENFPKTDSQLLIATHNPLMIGSLRKNQVRLVVQQKIGGGEITSSAVEPDDDPMGMGIDGLLTSEIYGLNSVLSPDITRKVHERNRLFSRKERSAKQDKTLRELSDELAELGIMRSYIDPYEREFVKAMSRRKELEQELLTPTEVRTRNQRADQILDEIFSKS